MFRSAISYTSQAAYMEAVLAQIPPGIGVLLTEHTHDRLFDNDALRDDFLRRFPQCILYRDTKTNHPSQYLVPLIDGVITTSSTVGLQALFWQKPLFVASTTSYLAPFADVCGNLAAIADFFTAKKKVWQDGALAWLMTRYYTPDVYYDNPAWFAAFLRRSVERHKHGMDFSFYDPIDALPILQKNICQARPMKWGKKEMGQNRSLVFKAFTKLIKRIFSSTKWPCCITPLFKKCSVGCRVIAAPWG
ncbi:MAG: hypothetical protein ACK5UY_05700 [Holosporales bacterium]